MTSKILLFVIFLLGNKLCQADLADDAESALNALRKITLNSLTRGFDEYTYMALSVHTVSLDTKESGFKLISSKTHELITELKKNKILNSAKIKNCYTTLSQLSKIVADDLATCVDLQAIVALNLIYNKNSVLADSTVKDIYDENKQVIFCGRNDADCMNDVIDDINAKALNVSNVINQEIEVDYQLVDVQLQLIKDCAAKAEDKVNNFAKKMCFVKY